MATTPGVMTVAEVAAFMQVSQETVYRLAARGELHGRKIGRIWRFPMEAVQKYVDGEPAAEHPGRAERRWKSGDGANGDVDPSAEQPCPSEAVERNPGPGNPGTAIHPGVD
ncbi:MAG: helix-turn-helix domain-containing protein [Planctomycetes bacterium]|nr:helix-turn-helix domain-containing protein [Planctomycetota bacterium]